MELFANIQLALQKAFSLQIGNITGGRILLGMAYFVAAALFLYLIISWGKERLSLRGAAHFVAPRDMHIHPSSRIDRWNWAFFFLWEPPVRAVTILAGLYLGVDAHEFLNGQFGRIDPLVEPAGRSPSCRSR